MGLALSSVKKNVAHSVSPRATFQEMHKIGIERLEIVAAVAWHAIASSTNPLIS
jgi:hypothetical protein